MNLRVKKTVSLCLIAGFLLAGSFVHGPVLAAGKGEKKAEASKSASEDAGFYIKMNPMILPVLGDKGVDELVSIVIALEVEDQSVMEKVNGKLPRLNDAYMRALYGVIDKSMYRNGHFIDITKVKAKLTYMTDMVLGHGVVRDVLIQGVNQRRFN